LVLRPWVRDKILKRGFMKIHSTRSFQEISISEAILNGLANDGGLFVWDHIDSSFFNDSFYTMSEEEVSTLFLKTFLPGFKPRQIKALVDITFSNRFSPQYFTFTHLDKASLLNVYHGPSFSFKDMALSLLPSMIQSAKTNLNIHKKTVILTATSGDTGGAALEGFKDDEETIVIVLYPKYNISPFQEKQMLSYQSNKAYVFGVDADFDACQTIVKTLLNEKNNESFTLSSANSINIGRIIAQTHYYLQSYLKLVKTQKIKKGDPIDIIVPTGNFGNIYAASVAQRFGVPINQMIVATNANNVLKKVFDTGVYTLNDSLKKTFTPAMDILVSSNLERFIYDQIKDPTQVDTWMKTFKDTGSIDLSKHIDHTLFKAVEVSDQETLNAISHTFQSFQTVIDPHTAVGVHAFNQLKPKNYSLIVSTASPYKFIETIEKALPDLSQTELESYMPYDERVKNVLNAPINDRVYSKEDVIKAVKKVMEHL